MSWFDEQVKLRYENDETTLRNAYEEAVNAVMGAAFSFEEAEDAVSLILNYYHLKDVKLPDNVSDEEKLAAVCRVSGLMTRPVELDGKWYRNAFGAFLGQLRDTGECVALLPDRMGRYRWFDRTLHKTVYLNKRTASMLSREAICFYKPLPQKKLSVADLVRFGVSAWSAVDFAMTFLMLGVSTLLGLLTPKLSYFLYGQVVEEGSVSLLLSTLFFFLCVSLSSMLIKTMSSLFSTMRSTKMGAVVESAAMMRVMNLPPNFFRQHSTGDVLQRMQNMSVVCSKLADMLFSTTLTSLFSLAYITQIFAFTPALVVPSLVFILINVIFSVLTTLRQMKVTRKQMELAARNSSMELSMVSGIQKIKLAGAEKRMFARWTQAFSEISRLTFNPPLFIKLNPVIILLISLAGQMTMYYMALESGVNVAEYYAFQAAYGMVSGAIAELAGIAIQAASLKPALEMIKPILETSPETDADTQEVTHLSGSIELNHVSFRYEDTMPNIIDDLSLKINSGQYVAIVGKTGCGKSTLVRLLLGFEKPQKGAIYYDGKDLATLEKRSLRQKIGTVMQDDKLFTGDIYSNIVICAPDMTLQQAWEAAELAGIAEDIRQMPMNMHTIVTEGGGGISGGQRQRLAIARAIAPKPKILIFDEATSALDNITQKQISDALDSLQCTRIVIAHRLSTIRHCDRILVMDKGHIIEEGTYDQLVEQNGYFAELVERQRVDA